MNNKLIMKKPLIAALALSLSVFSFAQKKELKAAEKAVKNTNFSEAKKILATVAPQLETLDDKLKAKYNYLKGLSLYANGAGNDKELNKGIALLNKSRKVYKVEVDAFKKEMLGGVVAKANKSYESKDYGPASYYFEKAYNLKKRDTFYLYYAASTAVNVSDYDRALKLYEKLKDLKYTGIETVHYAVDAATGQKVSFPNKNSQQIAVKTKTHVKPTTEKVKSKRAEIVKSVALIYINNGDNDKAIKAIKDAREEDPDDVNLIISEANIYYKTGDLAKFKEILSVAVEKDPENPELLYNLGVVSSESKQYDEAKKYYEKAIALDPKYVNAYINMSVVLIGDDQAIVDEMSNLGTSSADNKRFNSLLAKRKSNYSKAEPYLSKALEIDPKNLNAATTLKQIYQFLGETSKLNAIKAKIKAIESAQ